MGYTLIKNQPNRLGEFAGEGAEIVGTIGSTVTGVVQALTTGKVAIAQTRTQRAVAITEATESTKKMGIQTTGMTAQARIAAEQAKSKYRTVPIIILVSGATLIGAIAIGAWAYNKIVGEYEIEYE